jgi:signal transduction histidine kinase
MDADTTTGGYPVGNLRTTRDTMPGMPVASAARLVCVGGADAGRAFAIGAEGVVMGRGSGAGANLRANDISRRHARVFPQGDAFCIEDLGSTNGTFVNGAPVSVTEPTPIRVGDRIQLGESVILIFTHHDELEARMRQLQKLEAMEQVVGGLAHDFNNVLTVIAAGLEYLRARLPEGDVDSAEAVDDLKTAATDASGLVKRLLHFRQRETVPHEVIVLAPIVNETIAMARRVTTAAIDFSVHVDPLLYVRGSRDELQQVLLNLCINARDAMPDGGALTVTAEVVRVPRAEAMRRHLRGEGDYVELVVSDTGTGMSEAVLARAFEPFFTTKPAGQGTGLGLAMVHSIVRRYGGAIQVDSEAGRGTRFRIWLPTAV